MDRNSCMDRTYEFKGLWDAPSLCGLLVVKGPARHIVIATELYEKNPGTSVAGFAAGLAGLVCRDFGLDPEKLLFIEHCPDRKSKLENYRERFDRVTFVRDGGRFTGPDWHEMTKDEVNAVLAGEGYAAAG